MPEPAPVQLGRVAKTKEQRRAVEMMLYNTADQIDRVLADGVPYTKVRPDEFAQGGQ